MVKEMSKIELPPPILLEKKLKERLRDLKQLQEIRRELENDLIS